MELLVFSVGHVVSQDRSKEGTATELKRLKQPAANLGSTVTMVTSLFSSCPCCNIFDSSVAALIPSLPTCRFLYHKSFNTVSPYVQSMSQAVPDCRTENTVFSIDVHLHASVQVCYSFSCFVAGYRGLVPPVPIGYLVQLIKAVDHRRAS